MMIYLLILLFMTLFCIMAMSNTTQYKQTAYRTKKVDSTDKPSVKASSSEKTFADDLAQRKTEEMREQYAKTYKPVVVDTDADYADDSNTVTSTSDSDDLLEDITVDLSADLHDRHG